MRINNIQTNLYNTKTNSKQNVSSKGSREVLKTLANQDALASTILLEGFVTGGRGYNAYKRGGIDEFRERFVDDVVSAVFWMKGVDMFNNLGNKFGEHVLKLPTTEFDVGKDALRTPFNNLIDDLGKNPTFKGNIKGLEKKLAVFKFSKIILSTLLATGFVGFLLPKLNQALTRLLVNKEKQQTHLEEETGVQTKAERKNKNSKIDDKNNTSTENKSDLAEKITNPIYKDLISISIDQFARRISKQDTSFKGINGITTVAHYLENNKFCKLLSSDVGILAGRVSTARNADEGLEYLFRDSASSFFYMASTPLIYSLLQKVTNSSKYTTVDPVAAKQIHDLCLKQLGDAKSMSSTDFATKVLGSLDDIAKGIIEKLPFEKDVISLDKVLSKLDDVNLKQKATELAKLQPMQAGQGAVLTKQQVMDVFRQGAITDPKFMDKVYTTKFGEALKSPFKFIPMKKITSFRTSIDKYAQSVIDMANKSNNGVVDKQLLNKLNKKSFVMSAGFRAVAIGISAFALGVAIPKLQYAITKWRTGKNEAPGLREFQEEDKQTQKA